MKLPNLSHPVQRYGFIISNAEEINPSGFLDDAWSGVKDVGKGIVDTATGLVSGCNPKKQLSCAAAATGVVATCAAAVAAAVGTGGAAAGIGLAGCAAAMTTYINDAGCWNCASSAPIKSSACGWARLAKDIGVPFPHVPGC